jgi:hypothetical protein
MKTCVEDMGTNQRNLEAKKGMHQESVMAVAESYERVLHAEAVAPSYCPSGQGI